MYGKRARSVLVPGLVPVLVPVLAGGLIALSGLAACEEETNSPTTPTTPTNAEAPPTAPGAPEVQNVAINTTCPVGGEPIDPAVVVEYEGQTIAFCCNDCKAEWEAADEAGKAAIAAKARGDSAESGGGSGGGEQTGGG